MSDENESEMDTFLRILDERGKGRKAEVKLLWSDGTKSWVPRKDVEGQEVPVTRNSFVPIGSK